MANLDQPEEFRRALNEGAWLLRQNKPAEAMEKLQPLYEIAPNNADVAINLGGAYILQGKWNKAVRVLSKAAEMHPDNAMIWINLGAAHLGRLELSGPQQQERAIRAYERALQIDPTAPNVHYHLGLIHHDRGDWDKATAAFAAALKVNPNDRDAKIWLARVEAHRQEAEAKAAAGEAPASGATSVTGAEPDATEPDATEPGATETEEDEA